MESVCLELDEEFRVHQERAFKKSIKLLQPDLSEATGNEEKSTLSFFFGFPAFSSTHPFCLV